MEKKGIFAPPYGYLSDIFLPSASGYVLATYYRYDIDRENPKLFAGKNIENALRRPYRQGAGTGTKSGFSRQAAAAAGRRARERGDRPGRGV